jgi:dolichyl-phosphate mannosyltransferase polypeptide 2 regulatory subunit
MTLLLNGYFVPLIPTQPFVDRDHFVHKYFLPQKYANLISVLAGVVLVSFLTAGGL